MHHLIKIGAALGTGLVGAGVGIGYYVVQQNEDKNEDSF